MKNTDEIKRLNFNRNVRIFCYITFSGFLNSDAGCINRVNVKRCIWDCLCNWERIDIWYWRRAHWKGIERMSPFVCTQKFESDLLRKGDSSLLNGCFCCFFFHLFNFIRIITSTQENEKRINRTKWCIWYHIKRNLETRSIRTRFAFFLICWKNHDFFLFFVWAVTMLRLRSVRFFFIITLNGFYAN